MYIQRVSIAPGLYEHRKSATSTGLHVHSLSSSHSPSIVPSCSFLSGATPRAFAGTWLRAGSASTGLPGATGERFRARSRRRCGAWCWIGWAYFSQCILLLLLSAVRKWFSIYQCRIVDAASRGRCHELMNDRWRFYDERVINEWWRRHDVIFTTMVDCERAASLIAW